MTGAAGSRLHAWVGAPGTGTTLWAPDSSRLCRRRLGSELRGRSGRGLVAWAGTKPRTECGKGPSERLPETGALEHDRCGGARCAGAGGRPGLTLMGWGPPCTVARGKPRGATAAWGVATATGHTQRVSGSCEGPWGTWSLSHLLGCPGAWAGRTDAIPVPQPLGLGDVAGSQTLELGGPGPSPPARWGRPGAHTAQPLHHSPEHGSLPTELPASCPFPVAAVTSHHSLRGKTADT